MAMTAARDDRVRNRRFPTYIYITGHGHSGTTLLTLLLGRSGGIASMGEAAYLPLQCYRDRSTRWPGLCSCGERPFDCAVWGAVIESVARDYGKDLRSDPFSWRVSDIGLEEEYRRHAIWRSPGSWVRNRLWRSLRYAQYGGYPVISTLSRVYQPQRRWILNRTYVAERFAESFGAGAVVDSSKDFLGLRDLVEFSPLTVKVIFMTRDPRGNVWSYAKNAKTTDERKQRVRLGARRWNSANHKARRLLDDVTASTWMHLRYEDLCREPEKTLAGIMDFVGLPFSGYPLQEGSDGWHAIAGNKLRFGARAISVREDNTWRETLDEQELTTIRRICADLGAKLGYDL
ncbi:MAG: sulfotransferase [Proteobacteria bacterium]|nr:MAG: sulfotransferase [Pseudomonadota bacterium]